MFTIIILLQILLAYIIVDFGAGLYHLFTDMGYNIPSQVGFFRKHHEQPESMTFDMQPVLGAIPLAILAYFYYPWFFGFAAFFTAFAQIPHYYIHHPAKAPRFIEWLQRTKLIVSPESHNEHHYGNGKFDKNFCVFTGWCDKPINWLASKLIK